jgi:hypothetical protein
VPASEIPDDVMKAAEAFVPKWALAEGDFGPWRKSIAFGILAERERCASRADVFADSFERLAAEGGRKSRWNAVLAQNFRAEAKAIRDPYPLHSPPDPAT